MGLGNAGSPWRLLPSVKQSSAAELHSQVGSAVRHQKSPCNLQLVDGPNRMLARAATGLPDPVARILAGAGSIALQMAPVQRLGAIIAVLAILLVPRAFLGGLQAQFDANLGRIVGEVTGPDLRVIPEADVVVFGTESGVRRTVQCDVLGRFRVGSLRPGEYTVTASSADFAPATTDGVVRSPSEFSITLAWSPSMTATQEFVVPRSIPITLPIGFSGYSLKMV